MYGINKIRICIICLEHLRKYGLPDIWNGLVESKAYGDRFIV
jgi:hypothetical protein